MLDKLTNDELIRHIDNVGGTPAELELVKRLLQFMDELDDASKEYDALLKKTGGPTP